MFTNGGELFESTEISLDFTMLVIIFTAQRLFYKLTCIQHLLLLGMRGWGSGSHSLFQQRLYGNVSLRGSF